MIGDNVAGTLHPKILCAHEEILLRHELSVLLNELVEAEQNLDSHRAVLKRGVSGFAHSGDVCDLSPNHQHIVHEAEARPARH